MISRVNLRRAIYIILVTCISIVCVHLNGTHGSKDRNLSQTDPGKLGPKQLRRLPVHGITTNQIGSRTVSRGYAFPPVAANPNPINVKRLPLQERVPPSSTSHLFDSSVRAQQGKIEQAETFIENGNFPLTFPKGGIRLQSENIGLQEQKTNIVQTDGIQPDVARQWGSWYILAMMAEVLAGPAASIASGWNKVLGLVGAAVFQTNSKLAFLRSGLTRNTVEIDGHTMAYYDTHPNQYSGLRKSNELPEYDNVVVFVHGYSSSKDTWHAVHQELRMLALEAKTGSTFKNNADGKSSMTGDSQISPEQRGIGNSRVVMVELLGHGETYPAPISGDYRLEAQADFVSKAIDKIVYDSLQGNFRPKTILVGHSMGGGVVLEALGRPRSESPKVDGAVLIAPFGLASKDHSPVQNLYLKTGENVLLPKTESSAQKLYDFSFGDQWKTKMPSIPGFLSQNVISRSHGESGERLQTILTAIESYKPKTVQDLERSYLSEITSSSIFGAQDDLIHISGKEVLDKAIGGKLHHSTALESTGHLPLLEDPKAVAKVIFDTIKRVEASN